MVLLESCTALKSCDKNCQLDISNRQPILMEHQLATTSLSMCKLCTVKKELYSRQLVTLKQLIQLFKHNFFKQLKPKEGLHSYVSECVLFHLISNASSFKTDFDQYLLCYRPQHAYILNTELYMCLC